MVAGKNYNLQTKLWKLASKGNYKVFGSSVAAGLTRYVTCVGVIQDQGGMASAGSRVTFCSAAVSTLTSAGHVSATAKIVVGIGSYLASAGGAGVFEKTVILPSGAPNTEHPLFTVAASKFFSVALASAAGQSVACEVFAQWYDM